MASCAMLHASRGHAGRQTPLRPTLLLCQVPWQHVPDLVAMRRVHLANGVAYVHRHDMGSVIVSHFKELLTRALGVTARNWINHLAAREEGRLAPIVDGMSQR